MNSHRIAMITVCWAALHACRCNNEAAFDPQPYNRCVNGYLIEAAQRVGAPTDRKPTPEEMTRVQVEIDRKCGHLEGMDDGH